jgi:hypothetical protein
VGHFEFKLILDRVIAADEYDLLFDAGFDDSSLGVENGTGVIEVDRDAASLTDAVRSAFDQARAAGFDVIAIADEDLVGRATIAS